MRQINVSACLLFTMFVMYCASPRCVAQQIKFKSFGPAEGFTFPVGGRAFAQDSLGFLWNGTGGGLCRFDGYNFKVYKRDPKDSLSILNEGPGSIRTVIVNVLPFPSSLLTAKSGEDSKLEGLSKGADDYLTKPFNKQELLLKVRNGTQRMQKLREKLKVDVLSTVSKTEVVSQDEQFLNKVKETIIERMSDEQLSVESLADDIGMSRVQLYRKISALTGMAVNELIRKLRLQRAAQLLAQNWGPVSQVAYEVGFSNLSYFSKVFKEEFGVLPSEFTIKES